MIESEVITTKKIIKKMPEILYGLPSILKGIKVANNTDVNKPVGLGVTFEAAVKKNPKGDALVYLQQTFTYSQLNVEVNKLANYLLSAGVSKGQCVAIFIENRPELLISVLACAKIGAISAMLNTSQKGRVLSHSLNIAKPTFIIAGEECYHAYDEIRQSSTIKNEGHLYYRDKIGTDIPSGWLDAKLSTRTCSEKNPGTVSNVYAEDPCFYIYTSGTTGLPKAVIFNHGRFMKAYGSFGYAAVRLKKSDRMYVPLPFYHSTAMAVCWGSILAGSACLVLARKFSVSGFWSDIRRYNATSFGYVGELCRYLMEQPAKADDIDNSVRVIVGNGMRTSIWNEFKHRFGIKRVMEFYASSEGNIGFTNLLNFDRTVGMSPFPYAIVEYDKETDSPVRDNLGFMKKVKKGQMGLLIGEITAKSPFHGYTDASKTASCIINDALKSGDSWFNTGDIMRDLGFRHAQFIDRTGDTFRWKGENVSTTEVEMMLEEIEDVQEAIVYGVEIPNTNGRAGMASIKPAYRDGDIDFSLLLAELKKSLPNYAIPVFLRVNSDVQLTGTFKHIKGPLKESGYDLAKNKQSIYVWLPDTNLYQPLTEEIQQKIDSGFYRY
jgi:citronellyl-CoA synthetase